MHGTLTVQRYVDDILRPHVGPFLNGLSEAIFQHDNARPHTARFAQDFLHHFQTLPWLGRSPDLSPVVHVRDQLKREMPSCHSVLDLEFAVQDLWAHLSQDTIRCLRKTTRRKDRRIVRQALVDPTVTRSTIRADVGVAIVPQTISRHLAEASLKSKCPFHALPLTPEHWQLRLQRRQARSMWNVTDWQNVVFSDESRFVLGTDDNRVRVWRRPGALIGADCGKVLDMEVMSSYCKECDSYKGPNLDQNNVLFWLNIKFSAEKTIADLLEEWKFAECRKKIFWSEQKHRLKYQQYIVDGDSKTCSSIAEKNHLRIVSPLKNQSVGAMSKSEWVAACGS
ncbi:uncharacterized protein TNCV_1726051 [Trichonephila clavipes]|nr:uncharacterized protein TNCV_1726051 [Trichonephila clavipes]